MPEVSKVVEVMKVMEADEVVVWRHHGMVASPSGGHVRTSIPPALCIPPMLCIPPIIEWADITGAASTATTTAHPVVILRSMTILRSLCWRVSRARELASVTNGPKRV